jgi:hypothetical protein
LSAVASQIGPARQRSAAAWPPRVALAQRLKAAVGTARRASRQRRFRQPLARVAPRRPLPHRAPPVVRPPRSTRRRPAVPVASRPPPHAACPPPDRACPSALTPSSTPSPVAAPLSPHRRRPSPPVSRRLPAVSVRRRALAVAVQRRRAVRRARRRPRPSWASAAHAGRARCDRPRPWAAWPRAAPALCMWAEPTPRRGPRALCDWAEREFGPVHPVKFY